jgi:hypothetical protein
MSCLGGAPPPSPRWCSSSFSSLWARLRLSVCLSIPLTLRPASPFYRPGLGSTSSGFPRKESKDKGKNCFTSCESTHTREAQGCLVSAFRDQGVPKPTSECVACPSPDGSSAWASAKGGKRGGRRRA